MRIIGIEVVLAPLIIAIVAAGALVALSALHATEYDPYPRLVRASMR